MNNNFRYILVMLSIVLFSACSSGGGSSEKEPEEKPHSEDDSSTIKKTGQTKSYKDNGDEVVDRSIKDDGYYQKGLAPRYTRASDIVTDEITHLMWQDNEDVSNITKQWLITENYELCEKDINSPACSNTEGDTAENYCSELILGGYTDWRLPTTMELQNIVDYIRIEPAIDTDVFNYHSPSHYWTSQAYIKSKENAWTVYFNYGSVYSNYKYNPYYIRCVREEGM